MQKWHYISIGVEIEWSDEKRTRQSVLNAEKNAKSPSNQTEADQFTAENAILSAEAAVGDIKLT